MKPLTFKVWISDVRFPISVCVDAFRFCISDCIFAILDPCCSTIPRSSSTQLWSYGQTRDLNYSKFPVSSTNIDSSFWYKPLSYSLKQEYHTLWHTELDLGCAHILVHVLATFLILQKLCIHAEHSHRRSEGGTAYSYRGGVPPSVGRGWLLFCQ